MKPILSCEFNMDTACVELKFLDGKVLAIDTISIENEVAANMFDALAREMARVSSSSIEAVGSVVFFLMCSFHVILLRPSEMKAGNSVQYSAMSVQILGQPLFLRFHHPEVAQFEKAFVRLWAEERALPHWMGVSARLSPIKVQWHK